MRIVSRPPQAKMPELRELHPEIFERHLPEDLEEMAAAAGALARRTLEPLYCNCCGWYGETALALLDVTEPAAAGVAVCPDCIAPLEGA